MIAPATINLPDLPAREVLARVIYGEARNQSLIGMEAIACVVMNRVREPRWWGHDVITVCLDPDQFSCCYADDKNFPIITAAVIDNPIFTECLSVADRAISGFIPDLTGGADSYVVRGLKTKWNKNLTPCASIGAHDFYITIEQPMA